MVVFAVRRERCIEGKRILATNFVTRGFFSIIWRMVAQHCAFLLVTVHPFISCCRRVIWDKNKFFKKVFFSKCPLSERFLLHRKMWKSVVKLELRPWISIDSHSLLFSITLLQTS